MVKWSQIGAPILGQTNAQSGDSIIISRSGSRIAVGSIYDNLTGSVSIYDLSSSGWQQIGNKILGANPGAYTGWSIAFTADASKIIVCEPGSGGNLRGAARIFQLNDAGTWSQLGSQINGPASGDQTGNSVAISADGARICIAEWSANVDDRGAVYTYAWNAETSDWDKLDAIITGNNAYDLTGTSIALSDDGNYLVVGSMGADDDRGKMIAYAWDSNTLSWLQRGEQIVGRSTKANAGFSVSISASGRVSMNVQNRGRIRVLLLFGTLHWKMKVS